MDKLALMAILLCACAANAGVGGGANFSFSGTFTGDNQSQVFVFTAATSSVTIRTFGYAGGTNSVGALIPAGGFDPTLSLFDANSAPGPAPASLLLNINDDGASLPKDPVTNNAFDSQLVLNSLTPGGRYAVVITQVDNTPNGPDYGSGFHEDQGGPTFTSGLFNCGVAMFCDSSPAQRTGNWALDILGATGASNALMNVSPQVSVTQNGFARNRATGLWVANLTVTNTGSTTLNAPLQVLFTNLTSGVTMANNTGTVNGTPYLTMLPSGTLAPGGSVTLAIQFQNPSNGFINFTPVTEYVQF